MSATPENSPGLPEDLQGMLNQLKPFRSIPLEVSVELGAARLTLRDLLGLKYHSVFVLDQAAGAKLRICVNGVPLGTGEAAVVDNRVGIKIDEILDARR